ncbi:hypothetical protein TCAL_00138 [Tigriopus californicus]|uniref:Ubiquitin-conjugating enzyme E2 J2 n=1 Tax=Tigriopus californicus TaxID=6832 RepID=A0A553PFV4_TIGCA|nr:ubiquitin-conjugating enzyme E2 J2-like [Tigriopus californicus]TRY76560.1 hypothetical protein TCAL_00138 [Tigriopus californicus]|eukprot:TCALIF_00138-PA protein Name:"Similar to UBE2J2 Ubiquitin-conjugating enzyme E2 J2 (Homo sapiens)" AED:0.01 eAED:0.01 QI:0/-1/0/1/-1/1/1/0/239
MAPRGAANTTAASRLRQDYMRLKRDPVPYIVAEPLPANILEWHYVVSGPDDSLYAGGSYHGKLVFPSEFPFKPPSIYMITPNGRFKTNTRLCLSISDYHPDTWNPAWSVATILTGLLSFMLEKSPTLGSIETSDTEKRSLALKSHEFNLANKIWLELFPEQAQSSRDLLERRRLERLERKRLALTQGQSILNGTNSGDTHQGHGNGLYSAVANFLVIGGFAAFALIVQYVLQTISVTAE